ncbi:MAG: NAD(+) synthase [Clostridiales bacterium]|jgi:NAD+ synthase (glutamine-hydrolysing)|nr:NAD(+) synthase [Clostridiales bacterium]
MKDGFIKVAAATPHIVVADTRHNAKKIKECVSLAAAEGVKILVLPELCITGYTCGDLFYQGTLLKAAWDALLEIRDFTAVGSDDHSYVSDGSAEGKNGSGNSARYDGSAKKDGGLTASGNSALSDDSAEGKNGGRDDILVFVGLPFMFKSKIYNVAAAVKGGKILGLTPKSYLPNYNEFYDKRQFSSGKNIDEIIKTDCAEALKRGNGSGKSSEDFGISSGKISGKSAENRGIETPFSDRIIYECENVGGLLVSAEICEDLWVMSPPSSSHAEAGAVVLVNLSASNETVGKAEYRRSLVTGQSARLISAYIYASAGEGESTSDLVFGGHNIIAENGRILAERKPFARPSNELKNEKSTSCECGLDKPPQAVLNKKAVIENEKSTPCENAFGKTAERENRLFGCGMIISEIDLSALNFERSKLANYALETDGKTRYRTVNFALKNTPVSLTREYPKRPFVPEGKEELYGRAELILDMQSHALKKRLLSGFKAVVGVSGGLDSTLALLVAVRAMDFLGRSRKDIIGITMPCFGTSERTYKNSLELMKALGVTFDTIDIKESVKLHLADIGKYRKKELFDASYENAQARERTQVLMDIANAAGGIVVGTGDLSEAALGFCTYNGDHMSMYAVNSSVPKTLVKYLAAYEGARLGGRAGAVLNEILDTPISPELLPVSGGGGIVQRTEDIVGPYELHDFFLFYTVRFGFSPAKVLRIAVRAFEGIYDEKTVKKWLKLFIKRFFNNQFKRNCVPDGVKIGSVSLSPRGDFRMPSDAAAEIWIRDLED